MAAEINVFQHHAQVALVFRDNHGTIRGVHLDPDTAVGVATLLIYEAMRLGHEPRGSEGEAPVRTTTGENPDQNRFSLLEVEFGD